MIGIKLDMYQTLALAVAALLLGSFLRKRIPLLEKFCIPAPVIGGLIFAILTCILYGTGLMEVSFTDTLREVCMVFFFTSVGFQANLKVLKSGGKSGLFKNGEPLLFNIADKNLPAPRPLPEAWSGEGLAVACITLSDKGYAGEREDTSGPVLLKMLAALSPAKTQGFLLPDNPAALRSLVKELAAKGWGLIVSTGGTGLSPRDLTPEALLPILDRRLPGFEQVMFAEGIKHTPHAVLSRCLAGTIGQTMVLALPGSRRAAEEDLSVIIPILPHALEKLNGDMRDCGRI